MIARLIGAHECVVRSELRRRARKLSGEDLNDVIQEALLRMWTADLSRIKNERKFFLTVAINALFDWIRVNWGRIEFVSEVDLEIDPSPGPEVTASTQHDMERLREAVEKADLSDRVKEVFIAHYSKGLTISEIARLRGVREGTVEKQLRTAAVHVARVLTGREYISGRMGRPIRNQGAARPLGAPQRGARNSMDLVREVVSDCQTDERGRSEPTRKRN
jgi:RNA polymerase sigma factor (sigma-70 family)